MNQRIRIVAVQPALNGPTVEANLERIEELTRAAAAEAEPQLLVLPEAIGGAHVRDSVRPVDGAALHLLRMLARDLDVTVAGGFLARRGDHARSTYGIVEPDGTTRLINSAAPSPTTTALRSGQGAATTELASLDNLTAGLVAGRDWTAASTVSRIHSHVHLVIGGCAASTSSTRQREAPRQLARLLAVPVVLATPAGRGGGSLIIDSAGTVLADLRGHGEGYISGDVSLERAGEGAVEARLAAHWISPRGGLGRQGIRRLGALGAVAAYAARHVLGRHDWQRWPASDLPDALSASEAGRHATTPPRPRQL